MIGGFVRSGSFAYLPIDRSCPLLVALAILSAGALAFASDSEAFKPASISIVRPDWNAVRADAAELAGAAPADALARLNEATTKIFPGIATSPAPVLVPFDTRAYLRDLAADPAKPAAGYFRGFQATGFFLSGPAGYDAVFSVKSGDIPELVRHRRIRAGAGRNLGLHAALRSSGGEQGGRLAGARP